MLYSELLALALFKAHYSCIIWAPAVSWEISKIESKSILLVHTFHSLSLSF